MTISHRSSLGRARIERIVNARTVFPTVLPGLVALLTLFPVLPVLGDDAKPKKEDQTAAIVNDRPILARHVDLEIKRAFKDRKIDPDARPLIQAQTLEQLIKRRLIMEYLRSKKVAPTDAELDRARQRVEKQLTAQNIKIADFLSAAKLSENEFRDTLAWQIGWRRYLDRYLTDANLERYFKKNRRHFDGTQVHVAHILVKVPAEATSADWLAVDKRLRSLKSEVVGGKLSFADAARKHSQASTAKSGGDIGQISRHKSMPEGFSKAAFDLEKGGVSDPIRSKFGLHLIQCVDIQSGQGRWADAKKELQLAVTRYLFDWVASQHRGNARVTYLQGFPHFREGTSELAD